MKDWVTKDGKHIPVKDMENSHIENCINMLQRAIDHGTAVRIYGSFGGDDMDMDYEEIDVSEEFEERIRDFKLELLWRARKK